MWTPPTEPTTTSTPTDWDPLIILSLSGIKLVKDWDRSREFLRLPPAPTLWARLWELSKTPDSQLIPSWKLPRDCLIDDRFKYYKLAERPLRMPRPIIFYIILNYNETKIPNFNWALSKHRQEHFENGYPHNNICGFAFTLVHTYCSMLYT